MQQVCESFYPELEESIKIKKSLAPETIPELQNKQLKELALKYTQQKHDLQKQVTLLREQVKYMSKNSIALAKKFLSAPFKKVIEENQTSIHQIDDSRRMPDEALKYKKKCQKYKAKCKDIEKKCKEILENTSETYEMKLQNKQIEHEKEKRQMRRIISDYERNFLKIKNRSLETTEGMKSNKIGNKQVMEFLEQLRNLE